MPSVAFQSASLKPARTKPSPMRIGASLIIPSDASRPYCSSSLMVGSLSLSLSSLWDSCPLVLKNFFSGGTTLLCQSFNSSILGLFSLIFLFFQSLCRWPPATSFCLLASGSFWITYYYHNIPPFSSSTSFSVQIELSWASISK